MKPRSPSASVQHCPHCDHQILSEEINITEGVAHCGDCGSLVPLSQLNYSGKPHRETLSHPPEKIRVLPGHERMEIHVSLVSLPKFLASLLVTLFWNGIVSVFLSLAVAALIYQIQGSIPEWFPVPGLEDGKPVMNGEVMGPGMTAFLCLFLTPFVVIGTAMLGNTLLRLGGSTRIVIDPLRSHVSTGISFLRISRSFDPWKVVSVDTALNKMNQQGQENYHIALESTKTIRFGRLLSEEQMDWVVTLLRQVFLRRKAAPPSPIIPPMSWLDQLR